VIEDLIVSSDSDKSNHNFGIHNVQWKEGSTAEFVDMMSWADDEARTKETEQNEGMPDSTTASPIGEPLEGNDPMDQVVIEPKSHEPPRNRTNYRGKVKKAQMIYQFWRDFAELLRMDKLLMKRGSKEIWRDCVLQILTRSPQFQKRCKAIICR